MRRASRRWTRWACRRRRWRRTSQALFRWAAGRRWAAITCGRRSLRAARMTTLTDLLTIRLLWEEALFLQYHDEIADRWAEVSRRIRRPSPSTPISRPTPSLQEAGNAPCSGTWPKPSPPRRRKAMPSAQAAGGLLHRRALGGVPPGAGRRSTRPSRPSAFAGFFGLTAAHKGFASDVAEHRLPVLLNPGVHLDLRGDDPEADLPRASRPARKRAWGRFKLAAVSSFAFVEATGPIYAGKLVRDALSMAPNKARAALPPARPRARHGRSWWTRRHVLRAMSLTVEFRADRDLGGSRRERGQQPVCQRLHCGACGGYSGEVNARLLAGLLNVPTCARA
jgi:uncharacterized protein YbcC (UPF0753/DUF2309 family)